MSAALAVKVLDAELTSIRLNTRFSSKTRAPLVAAALQRCDHAMYAPDLERRASSVAFAGVDADRAWHGWCARWPIAEAALDAHWCPWWQWLLQAAYDREDMLGARVRQQVWPLITAETAGAAVLVAARVAVGAEPSDDWLIAECRDVACRVLGRRRHAR